MDRLKISEIQEIESELREVNNQLALFPRDIYLSGYDKDIVLALKCKKEFLENKLKKEAI